MRFELLFLGRTREPFLAAGIDHYLKRVRQFVPAEIRTLKEKRWSPQEAEDRIRAEESALLLSRISRPSLAVLLDRRGAEVSSEGLADLLGAWEEAGHRNVTFVVGGPLGFTAAALKETDAVVSLSRMTLTHEMARLLLLEQLYRALTIRAGTGYHK